jgi:hypothetical protein
MVLMSSKAVSVIVFSARVLDVTWGDPAPAFFQHQHLQDALLHPADGALEKLFTMIKR